MGFFSIQDRFTFTYKLYAVFKWRLLSKGQVFVQKTYVHLLIGFLDSLATTSVIPIDQQTGEKIVVLQESHSKYHIVSIVLLDFDCPVLQGFVLSEASKIDLTRCVYSKRP